MGLQSHWQMFITGFVVIGAVLLDNARNKASAKAKVKRASAAKAALK